MVIMKTNAAPADDIENSIYTPAEESTAKASDVRTTTDSRRLSTRYRDRLPQKMILGSDVERIGARSSNILDSIFQVIHNIFVDFF